MKSSVIQKMFDAIFGEGSFTVVESKNSDFLFQIYTQWETRNKDFKQYDSDFVIWEHQNKYGFSWTVRDETVGVSDYNDNKETFISCEAAARGLIFLIVDERLLTTRRSYSNCNFKLASD